MASISLERVSKRYADGSEALSELSLHVADGELLVMVGPSGCGKTTALRVVAGFEDATAGQVRIGERVVDALTPKQRDVAMVFQNYALYPHLTVAGNIGLGMRMRKVPRRVRSERIRAAAGLLGLEEHLDRKPAQLSGGQRQRVAMGRAIVREPAAFLLDEPLSNLDAKLRVEMRAEIVRLHRRLGVATLYVTHDMTEAMTLGERVAVLREGVMQQCDAPQAIHERPANLFVAAFVGSPAMNLYEARLERGPAGPVAVVGELALPVAARDGLDRHAGRAVVAGIRPQSLSPAGPQPEAAATLDVHVELVEMLGDRLLVHFSGIAPRIVPRDTTAAPGAAGRLVGGLSVTTEPLGVATAAARSPVAPGDRLTLAVDPGRVYLFDAGTGRAIG